MSMPICFLFLVLLPEVHSSFHDDSCPQPRRGGSSASEQDLAVTARQLLQLGVEQKMPEDQSEPANTGISAGKGARSESLLELRDPSFASSNAQDVSGYVMASSVGDVSSVVLLPQLHVSSSSGNFSNGHPTFVSEQNRAGTASSVEVLVVVFLIIVSIFVVLLSAFAGFRRSAEPAVDDASSDSEAFFPNSRYQPKARKSPQMRTRAGWSEPPMPRSPPPPVRRSPVPPPRQQPYPEQRPPYGQEPPDARPYYPEQPPPRVPPSPYQAAQRPQPSSVTSEASAKYLCPALVVPEGHDCVLAVPTLKTLNVPPRDSALFFVRDLQGNPMIQAEIVAVPWYSLKGGVSQRPIALLRAAAPDKTTLSDKTPLLAYVKTSMDAGGTRTAYIYNGREDIFAHLAKDPFRANYVLTSSRMGSQVIFTGNFAARHFQAANDDGESVAEVEPCTANFEPMGDYFKIRVFAQIDVGLILCGLLAIQHIEEP